MAHLSEESERAPILTSAHRRATPLRRLIIMTNARLTANELNTSDDYV